MLFRSGLGLAELMPSRNPLLDGFGLVAFACTFPAITVLGYAQIAVWLEKRALRRNDDAEYSAGKEG